MAEDGMDAKKEMRLEKIMTLIDHGKKIIIITIDRIMESLMAEIIDIMIEDITEVGAEADIKIGIKVGVEVEAEAKVKSKGYI